jgi:hypothetical protein
MKTITKAIILFLTLAASVVFAQPYGFDEYGIGTSTNFLNVPPSSYPLPSQVAMDPTGGITDSPVLIYSLGLPVTSGDVAFTNADGTINNLLRFFTPSGAYNSSVIYYGRADDPHHAPADVGIPATTNPIEISKQLPTTVWFPAFGVPGHGTAYPAEAVFIYFIKTTPLVSYSGTNFVWTVTDGATNTLFRVLGTTNLAAPLTNWTYLSTNSYDASGNCMVILPMEPDKPHSFYRLSTP